MIKFMVIFFGNMALSMLVYMDLLKFLHAYVKNCSMYILPFAKKNKLKFV